MRQAPYWALGFTGESHETLLSEAWVWQTEEPPAL